MGYTLTLTPSILLPKIVDETLSYNINTISGGFVSGGSSRSTPRKYARHVLAENVISHNFPRGMLWKE